MDFCFIEEGLNTRTWTVGVSVSGNAMGLPLAEWQALAPAEIELRGAGEHYVIDSMADLPYVLDTIATRSARGGRPAAPWRAGRMAGPPSRRWQS